MIPQSFLDAMATFRNMSSQLLVLMFASWITLLPIGVMAIRKVVRLLKKIA